MCGVYPNFLEGIRFASPAASRTRRQQYTNKKVRPDGRGGRGRVRAGSLRRRIVTLSHRAVGTQFFGNQSLLSYRSADAFL